MMADQKGSGTNKEVIPFYIFLSFCPYDYTNQIIIFVLIQTSKIVESNQVYKSENNDRESNCVTCVIEGSNLQRNISLCGNT